METTKYLLIFISIFLSNTILSQDKIVLKNGENITAFIVEKSEKKIKYKIMDSDNSPIIILKAEKVEKIVFRNGREIILPDLIRMNNRFAVRGGLIYGLSVESAFYTIGADYFVSPGISVELNGLISVEDGGGIEIGAKYFFDPYKPTKLKGYAGLLIGASYENVFLQVPFGINYIGEKGFDFRLGLRGVYDPSNSAYSIYSELTLGWRF